MASKKNIWRRRGQIEFRRETSRLSDGTAWGDTLWIRSIGRDPRTKGRAIAYCHDRKDGNGARLGLNIYHTPTSRRDAVACAKAALRYLKREIQSRNIPGV